MHWANAIHILGIDTRKLRFTILGIQNVHFNFYSVQFLHVQRHRFIRINYINVLLSLYDTYTCMLFLHLNQMIYKRKYMFRPKFNENTTFILKNMVFRFSCVSSVIYIYRNGCLQTNKKHTSFLFLRINQQPHCYISINGNSNIHNVSCSNEDKTDIGACPAHSWRLSLCWWVLFVLYNNYLISCGRMCTFSYKIM